MDATAPEPPAIGYAEFGDWYAAYRNAVLEPALWVPLMQLDHFMPGTLGIEALRIYGFMRTTANAALAVASVAVDRLLGTFALILLTLCGLALLPAVIGLIGITVLAWLYLVWMAHAMPGMGGMAEMAMPMIEPWSAADWLAMFLMWAIMMVAMMLPSAAPTNCPLGGPGPPIGSPERATGQPATRIAPPRAAMRHRGGRRAGSPSSSSWQGSSSRRGRVRLQVWPTWPARSWMMSRTRQWRQ